MWAYSALLLFPLAASLPRFRKMSAVQMATLAVLLCLVIGLRREVGGDWDSYLLMYHRAHSYALGTALALGDPAYVLAGRVLAGLGLGIAALNLVCAALFSAGLILFCAARPRPWLALLIATPVLIVIVAMGYTRQSAALGLAMIALSIWPRRPIVAAALLILAPAWHWSAVVFLPLIGILALRRPLHPALAVATGVAASLAIAVATRLPPFAEYAQNTQHSAGALLRLAPNVCVIGLMLGFGARIRMPPTERNALWYWILVSIALIATAAYLPTLADRLGAYAILGQIAVLTRLPDLLRKPKLIGLAAGLVAVPYLALLAGWLALTPYRICWEPYRSYLVAPAGILFDRHDDQYRRDQECKVQQYPKLEQSR